MKLPHRLALWMALALMVALAGCAARPRMAAEYSETGDGEKPRRVKKQKRYTLVSQSESTVQYNRGALLGTGGAVATTHAEDAPLDADDWRMRTPSADEGMPTETLKDEEGLPSRTITQEEGRAMPDGDPSNEPYVADNEGEELTPTGSASDSLRHSFDLDDLAKADIEPAKLEPKPKSKQVASNQVTALTDTQVLANPKTASDVADAIEQMQQAADRQETVTGGGESLAQTVQQEAAEANAPTAIQGIPELASVTQKETTVQEVEKTTFDDGETETTRTILPGQETETSTATAAGPVETTVPGVTVGEQPAGPSSDDAKLADEMNDMAGEDGVIPPPEAPVDTPVAQKGPPAGEQVVPDDTPPATEKAPSPPPEPAEVLPGSVREEMPPETALPEETAGPSPSTDAMKQQLQNMIATNAEETQKTAAEATIGDPVAEGVSTVEAPMAKPETGSEEAVEVSEATEKTAPAEPTPEVVDAEVETETEEAALEVPTLEAPPTTIAPEIPEMEAPAAEAPMESLKSNPDKAAEETAEETAATGTPADTAPEDAASTLEPTVETTEEASSEIEETTGDSPAIESVNASAATTEVAVREDVAAPSLDEEKVAAEVETPSTPEPEAKPEKTEAFLGEEVRTLVPEEPMSNDVAIISTRLGDIVIELDGKAAPQTVTNFKKLAKENFYNRTTFHRVIPHFIVQGGDPFSKDKPRPTHGEGGPGYVLKPEISLQHRRGSVAAARLPDDVNPLRYSNGSQFYICVVDAPSLDGKNTVFGRVLKGMEVVDKIAALPRDDEANPLRPLRMDVTIKSREVWENE